MFTAEVYLLLRVITSISHNHYKYAAAHGNRNLLIEMVIITLLRCINFSVHYCRKQFCVSHRSFTNYRWWNHHDKSDPDSKPERKFAWSSFENCWSPERMDYALVCAESDAPPGLTGAVFAVGTSFKEKEGECRFVSNSQTVS